MGANLNLPFGVRVSKGLPLDAERYIVADQAAMDVLIIENRAYEGLMVYNEDDETPYYLKVLGITPALSTWAPLITPLTIKGDLLIYGLENSRFPVGPTGRVLMADDTQPLGVKWASLSGGGDMLQDIYDRNSNGTVDNSEKLGGLLPAAYQTKGVVETISYPNHGKVKGDTISKIDLYYDYADNVKQLPATFMIVEVVDNNTLKVASIGIFDWDKSALIEGAVYYQTTNGNATEVYQEDNSQQLFTALSANKIELDLSPMFSETIVTPVGFAVKFKSFAETDTTFNIGYTGLDTVLWTDGVQNLTGTSVTFNWTNDDTKEVTINVADLALLNAQLLTDDENIFELNMTRLTKGVMLYNGVAGYVVKRIYFPNAAPVVSGGGFDIDYNFADKLQKIGLQKATITDLSIRINQCPNLELIIQPETAWSVTELQVNNSVIYGTFGLDNLTINGILNLNDNPFIEEIKFNPDADWTLCNDLGIDSSDLLKFVDFSIMTGILTNNNTKITVKNIGSTQSDMDNMLSDLVGVVPDNSATGRIISILGGAPPSSAGLADKVILESYGINVTL